MKIPSRKLPPFPLQRYTNTTTTIKRTAAEAGLDAGKPKMQYVSTKGAATAVGPYSQAVVHKDTVYVSGCIGLQAGDAGTLVPGGVLAEAEQAFANMEAILKEAGSSFGQVLKVTVYMAKMQDFAEVNKLYQKVFGDHRPARACVGCSELPKGMFF